MNTTQNPTQNTTQNPKCLNCGGRGHVGGRISLPNGKGSTKAPCFACKGK